MRTVRVLGVLIAAALVVVTPATSAAGGGAVLLVEDGYSLVGEEVTARATFSAHVRRTGRISDGPWYAYLVPGRQWIGRGPIPGTALLLGELEVELVQPSPAIGRASITFTVPDVEPGPYSLSICNEPCTEPILGDLMGGWLSIARTEEQSQIQRMRSELETGLRSVRWLRHAVERNRRQLEESIAELTERLDRLQETARRPAAGQPEGASPLGTGLAFAAGVGAVLCAWFLLHRARQPLNATSPKWDSPEERRLLEASAGGPEQTEGSAELGGQRLGSTEGSFR